MSLPKSYTICLPIASQDLLDSLLDGRRSGWRPGWTQQVDSTAEHNLSWALNNYAKNYTQKKRNYCSLHRLIALF